MKADYIEILSDDDDVLSQQPASRLVDVVSDSYILIDDEVPTVVDGSKGKQKAVDVHEDIILLGSSSPPPPPSSNPELPDLEDILGIKRLPAPTRKQETQPISRIAPSTFNHPSSDIDVFSSSPPQPRAPPTLVARSRTAAPRPPPRLAGTKSSMAPLPYGEKEKSEVPLPADAASCGDFRWEMTDDEMESELIRQAGLDTGGGGGSKKIGQAEESEPVAGPSRLAGEVMESRGATAKRSRTSVRRDSKLDGGVSDGEVVDSSMPKAKKAKPTNHDTDGRVPTAAEKKAAKKRETAEKARFVEANKLRSNRNDTIREITIHISSDLHNDPTSPLYHVIPTLRAKFETNLSQVHLMTDDSDDRVVPGLIKFKRFVQARYNSLKKVFEPLPRGEEHWQDETMIILVKQAKDLIDLISRGQLCEWLSDIKDVLKWRGKGRSMVLVIHGMKQYYAKTKSIEAKAYRESALEVMNGRTLETGATVGPARTNGRVMQEEVEKELARLHMLERCFQVHVDKKEDLEEWVWNLAADIAIRPYKLIQKSHLPFSTEDVARKGKTPSDTFQLMLQQIPLITPSGASGVAEHYSTFRELMEAFEKAERDQARGRCGHADVEGLLRDCPVRNLTTGVENHRLLGNARSARIYNVFRGRDSHATA